MGTSFLAATYLKNINFKGKLYVIGSKAVCQELDEFGIKHTGIGVSQSAAAGDQKIARGAPSVWIY